MPFIERNLFWAYGPLRALWHGGSVDEAGSPLEAALNEVPHDLRLDKDPRLCSQIIHSFGFSMSDAIH